MPKVLAEADIDPITEEVNQAIDLVEEQAALPNWTPATSTTQVGDLSDGGKIGDVSIYPTHNGVRQDKGRPTVRRAWMWNGSESMLPLGWNTEGTRHDAARPYLLKRHCICCNFSGFRGGVCPDCARKSCQRCAASTDRSTVNTLGNKETARGWVIPCFYLRPDMVPFPSRFYGNVDCFQKDCPRKGAYGFMDEEGMRMHASQRHRMEYQTRLQVEQGARTSELETLRMQVATLMMNKVVSGMSPVPSEPSPAPLYISDKAKPARRTVVKRKAKNRR